MTHLIAQIFAWLTRLAVGTNGRHRRPVPAAHLSPRRQREGLAALLAVARPVPTPARLPVRRRRRVVIPLDPAPDPILMDGCDPRRYRFIRPSYLSWERQRDPQPGEFAELASVVRVALSLGIGR
ncbi:MULTISPECIES: hypothetical protein [unclassified Nocardiopsis]|uniref:hypothetical protein n=1 Tax=unclassified Nocardiopsis TaxID=2649073 RepID=UPI00135B4580|nr:MULTISPECIES: hypothetical protein [unclassified Nocardiopsis]